MPAYCYGPAGPGPNVCTDNGCILDVLVVYTPAARDLAMGYLQRPISEVIGEAVDAMNIAFENSQIPTFVRLMGSAEVDYNEYNDIYLTDALDCLSNPSCMPVAHSLRSALKADIVSLFVARIPGDGVAGVAYILDSFNVVRVQDASAENLWAFAHEMGHDLGAHHEVGNAPRPYCHAYVRTASPYFSTIVASYGLGKILHYSNPEVYYLGVPSGTAAKNNAQCIREFAPSLAIRSVSDCNLNGVCDVEDIAAGTSEDCDNNGIPDECDALSDSVGACCLAGTCTYATELCCVDQGGSFKGEGVTCDDCNGNTLPDACETGLRPCCVPPLLPGQACKMWTAQCCSDVGGDYYPTEKNCDNVICFSMAPSP